MMLAVTPELDSAPLMASRMPASVLLLLSMSTSNDEPPALTVSVPVPMVEPSLQFLSAALVSLCAWARASTSMEYEPSRADSVAFAVKMSELLDEALR